MNTQSQTKEREVFLLGNYLTRKTHNLFCVKCTESTCIQELHLKIQCCSLTCQLDPPHISAHYDLLVQLMVSTAAVGFRCIARGDVEYH